VITTLSIGGMTCNGCAKHVDAALRALPGVSAVKVQLAANTAEIVHDPQQSQADAMIAAIERAGYSAAVTPAPAGA
jgi:copper chaperone CopZ